jgi:uncharacterized protein (TIGR03905 family)
MIEYTPVGTCSRKIEFDLREGRVYSVKFTGGCDGNLKALGILLEGSDAGTLVSKLKGVDCGGRGTSCSDQLARAVEAAAK